MSILAPVKAYIKYSMELKQVSPTVAYYCKLFAVNKGFDLMKQNQASANIAEIKKYLMEELKELEQMKAVLGSSTKEDHQPEVENFIFAIFAKIDKEERTVPQLTKAHALDFKRCSDFIQILSLFGAMEAEWQERDKYCKFKAGTILKYLKSGEDPPRGNPFAQEEEQFPPESQNDQSMNETGHFEEEQKEPNHFNNPYAAGAGASLGNNISFSGHSVATPNPDLFPQYNPVVVNNNQPPAANKPMNSYSYADQQPPSQQLPSTSAQSSNPYQPSLSHSLPAAPTHHIQPSMPQPVVARSGTVKKDAAYFKAIQEAKKKAQNAVSELDFSNVNNAIKFFKEALQALEPYETL